MSKLDWYAALLEGNCLKINDILDKDERKELLFMWPDESEAERMESGWKGCNALHVAVKQGCNQLVMRIIDKSDEYVNMSSQRSNMSPPTLDTYGSLGDMILAFEGNCKLDTIAIALLNGDRDVTWLLAEALLVKCRSNPYGIELGSGQPVPTAIDEYKLERIREITRQVLEKMGDGKDQVVEYYRQQCEFNFLPMDEYLFLALCSYSRGVDNILPLPFQYKEGWCSREVDIWKLDADIPVEPFEVLYLFQCRRDIVVEILKRDSGRELLMFLLELKDGRGRTALHIGVDHRSIGDLLRLLGATLGEDFGRKESTKHLVNTRDRVGRTPLHRAVAAFDFPMQKSSELLVFGADVDLSFEFKVTSADCFVDVRKVSARNGFVPWFPHVMKSNTYSRADFESLPIRASHLAIFNPFIEKDLLIELFQEKKGKQKLISLYSFKPYLGLYLSNSGQDGDSVVDVGFAPLGLAALVGNINVLQHMIEYDDVEPIAGLEGESSFVKDVFLDSGKIDSLPIAELQNGLPGLHLAAATGDSLAVQIILSSNKFDHNKRISKCIPIPWWRTPIPSTALHAAVRGWPEIDIIGKNLLHVVNFQNGWRKKIKYVRDGISVEADRYNREACVNLLLQAGASIWDPYGRQHDPKPGPGTSPEFRAWWTERVERETQEKKASLTTAANAISVTAALVATASYVGPLQPPMGYGEDDMVQVGKLSVKLFIIFDTLAFYVALSAVVLAMVPSLPMSTESVQSEGKRARKSVLFAVILLVVSLVCILVAFAAASIAVISNDGSWNHGGVTISTVIAGGFICILTIGWFAGRLLRLVKSLVLTSPDQYRTLGGYLWFYSHILIRQSVGIIQSCYGILVGFKYRFFQFCRNL